MTNDLVRQDYRGADQLSALIRFAQRIWTIDNRWHIGDLAWDIGLTPESPEWRIAYWMKAGEIAGVGWLSRPDQLSLVVGPDDADIVDGIIEWADDLAGAPVTVTILDTETWLVGPLDRRGYTRDPGGHFFVQMIRDLAELPPVPALPEGYAVRAVRIDETGALAALHRAVWDGSAMSDETFGAMTRRWPYQSRFDWVVEAPDGALVSYILGWYDDVNRVGEFEPVGTLREARRKGLSRVVGTAVLHAFREAGGERAIVYARGDDDYPIPRQVYGSLGFEIHGRTVKYQPKR